jgi:hypothetical protein
MLTWIKKNEKTSEAIKKLMGTASKTVIIIRNYNILGIPVAAGVLYLFEVRF